jgi:hypothetical protein
LSIIEGLIDHSDLRFTTFPGNLIGIPPAIEHILVEEIEPRIIVRAEQKVENF